MSGGAAPGDNGAWSTNFPVVRLTAADGTVTYARTHNWSVGVQTGAALQSTEFTLPAVLPGGQYTLQVIASGIASTPFPFLVPPTSPQARPGTVRTEQAKLLRVSTAPLKVLSELHRPHVPASADRTAG